MARTPRAAAAKPAAPAPVSAAARRSSLTKKAFVRSFPPETKPSLIIAKGKEAHGWDLSETYVYSIRSWAKKEREEAERALDLAKGPSLAKTEPSDSEFRRLIVAMGPIKARRLLEDTEVSLEKLVAGVK
jgi:hypothetical protein